MHKLNVALAIDSLEKGGIETLAANIVQCTQTSRNKCDYFLICSKSQSDYPQLSRLIDKNVFIIERTKFFNFSYIMRLRSFLKAKRISILHSHSPVIGIYSRIAGIGLRIRFFQTIHGFWDSQSSSGKMQLIHQLLTDLLYLTTERTFMVSFYIQSHYKRRWVSYKKSAVLYNGVYTRDYIARYRTINLAFVPESITFGMLGNFNHGRDYPTLIYALNSLLKKDEKIKLVIGGTGEMMHEINKLVSDLNLENKIILIGKVIDTIDFFSSINCYVYSSRYDSFGISVVEAMMLNIPVIVSDNGPFREITNNGAYATLFKAGDSFDLAQKMCDFIFRFKVVRKSKTILKDSNFLDQFYVEEHLSKLEEHYLSIADSNK